MAGSSKEPERVLLHRLVLARESLDVASAVEVRDTPKRIGACGHRDSILKPTNPTEGLRVQTGSIEDRFSFEVCERRPVGSLSAGDETVSIVAIDADVDADVVDLRSILDVCVKEDQVSNAKL